MQNARKKLFTLLASLVLVSMLALTACGGSAGSNDSSQGESEATSTTETASSPEEDSLAKIGFSEVQPYIDMIDKVSSIDELNALLASEDFPFTPFVNPILYVVDMHGENVVAVCPNFIIADGVSQGGTYYQGTEAADTYLEVMFASKMGDASLIMGPDFDPIELKETIIGFEKSYGKFADCSDVYLNADYGTYAKAVEESVFTLDELCALCPNMPMKEMLVKCKKDGASAYSAISSGWIEALNDLWTEDNLDTIKLITKFKVLVETSPYRDKSVANETTELDASMLPDQESNAFTACNSIDTFAQVIAKEYVDGILGQQGEGRPLCPTGYQKPSGSRLPFWVLSLIIIAVLLHPPQPHLPLTQNGVQPHVREKA